MGKREITLMFFVDDDEIDDEWVTTIALTTDAWAGVCDRGLFVVLKEEGLKG